MFTENQRAFVAQEPAIRAQTSLYELYNSLFEGIIADSQELIDECYKLRYKVYCLENPYQEPNPAYGEYERDQFDGHSVHALLRYRPTGEFIGTVRLIVNHGDSPSMIPIQSLCEEHHIQLPASFNNKPYGEISRFCISKSFRRRVTDTMYGTAYTARELAEMRGRVIPYMALGLINMVVTMGREEGLSQVCAVMEPSLIRLLDKLGIHFLPVGPTIEFHGTRQISYINVTDLGKSLSAERPEVLELLTEQGRFPLDASHFPPLN